MSGSIVSLPGVGEALALAGRGQLEAARARLGDLWSEAAATGDALHRCSIAHTMADLQPDAVEELAWDLRALDAALEVDDERLMSAGMIGTAEGMLPSLHLNPPTSISAWRSRSSRRARSVRSSEPSRAARRRIPGHDQRRVRTAHPRHSYGSWQLRLDNPSPIHSRTARSLAMGSGTAVTDSLR